MVIMEKLIQEKLIAGPETESQFFWKYQKSSRYEK